MVYTFGKIIPVDFHNIACVLHTFLLLNANEEVSLDPFHKWLPIINSFVSIKISLIFAARASSNINRIYEEYIEGDTKSRIHHFLPECIAFNQNALRHFLPECIAPRTT